MLEERLGEIEALVGIQLDEPHTGDTVVDQLTKLKETVTKALAGLSEDIRKNIDEGTESRERAP